MLNNKRMNKEEFYGFKKVACISFRCKIREFY